MQELKIMSLKNKINKNPIGIFDSGIGGVNVVKEIHRILPYENIVYLGDTARVPYGTKSKETIIRYSIENTNFLLKFKIKLLVVACNTSSSYALPVLKKMLNTIPVVGVILPGAIKAIQETKNNRIGVIGTPATIKSGIYKKTIISLSKKKKSVISVACPLFVPLIEEGWIDRLYQEKGYHIQHKKLDYYRIINHENILRYVATEYLSVLKQKNVDVLVLGCTHYPAIKTILKEVMGPQVTLVDSAEETAKFVYETLKRYNMLNIPHNKNVLGKLKFYVTDDPQKFKLISSWLIGKKINFVKKVVVENV